MSLEARCVWEQGFPRKTQLIVDEEYSLTVERCTAEASRYLKMCLVFAYDSEYALWRDLYPSEGFLPSFARALPGAVEWREFILVWVVPLEEHLTRTQKERILLAEYLDFLSLLRIKVTPALMPKVKWFEMPSVG